MRRIIACVVLSVLALPAASRADGSIQVVGRAGVAKPYGDVGDGAKLGDTVEWAFPLEAQLSFRLLKSIAVGAYARYAPTTIAGSCEGCTINGVGFGVVTEYRFSSRLEGGPWIGLSAGYEQLETGVKGGGSRKATGFEGAVSAGADFELGGLTLGPYVQASAGQFGKTSFGGETVSISDKGTHGFFGAGIRLLLLL